MATETVQSILDEQIEYSSYSAEESFTLSDILGEKDEIDGTQLFEAERIQSGMFTDDFDDMFEDEEEATPEEKQPEKKEEPVLEEVPHQEQENKQIVRKSQEPRQILQEGEDHILQEEVKVIDRCRRIQNIAIPHVSQIKNIVFIVLNNVTSAFDDKSKGVGIPTVITSNSIQYLAIGTSFGNVVLFEVGNKGKTILGTSDNRKHGPISAIAIARSGRYLVCGQENGLVTIWDLTTYQQIKKEMGTETKIVKILFCSDTQFILADIQGNVFLFTIENYFWIKLKRDRLFEKSSSVYYDVKLHTLQSGVEVVVLCSLEQVLIATYKPKVEAIDRLVKPDQLMQSKIPNIEIGKTAILSIHNPKNRHFHYNDVLCVSWANHILVYKFMQGIRLQKLQLVYRFIQETPIYNLQFISEGVLVTLDNKETFRSYRLWINEGGGHQLLNEKVLPQEVIYQRYIRDSNNKYIKLFNNTIISCAFNPRQKELFFICKNSICRCRIYKWNEYISDLINFDNQLEKALKICIEIHANRMDVFLEPVNNNEKTLKIFCEVGKIYLSKRMELIDKLKVDRAHNMDNREEVRLVEGELRETYDCIIEYMLEIRCSQQLFKDVYEDSIKQNKKYHDEYQFIFLECLEPFIVQGRVNSLPSKQMFQELMDYYIPLNKRQLIDNLIMFLDVQTLSMFYENAISICSDNKLYKSLAYVCSTHQDYVPPLTNLLNEVRLAQINHMEVAQETYYAMLKDYIVKLLSGCYINGTAFDDNRAIMKKSLSNWLMCRETFTFFVKNQVEAYRSDYFYFIEELVYLLSSQPQLEDYIHCELKHITREEFHDREVAELFIKISEIIKLEPDQIRLVARYSDASSISKYLSKYLNFYRTYNSALREFDNFQHFYSMNMQLHYFHHLLEANHQGTQESLLSKVNLLEANRGLNGELTKYLLSEMGNEDILWNLEELLKIHPENTMIFMLEKFSVGTVSERLLSIKDPTYRYVVVRKILKKLRKENSCLNGREKIKKYHRKKPKDGSPTFKRGSPLRDSRLVHNSESDTDSVMEMSESEHSFPAHRRLSQEVMKFYIECLCKYKNEKRAYYELICNTGDYSEAVEELIAIIQKYEFYSCLGLLEQTRKHYQEAYLDYSKVYRYFFFEENYKKLVHYNHCHGRFVRRMFERMLFLTGMINTEQQWMDILKCIISPLEEGSVKRHERGKSNYLVCDDIEEAYVKEPDKYVFIRQLNYIIEQCLINASIKIPIETISNYIGEHEHVFSRMFVLESFRATLETYTNNAKIYHIANDMMTNNQVETFEAIHQNLIKGFPPTLNCEECGANLDQETPMKTYPCGHSYHQVCPVPSEKASRVSYRPSLIRRSEMRGKSLFQQEKKCPRCDDQYTKGSVNSKQAVIADFHKEYEENILVKGMVGIVTIIPNMMSINAFSAFIPPLEEKVIAPIEEEETNAELDEQVLGYLAFNENLQQLQEENDRFIHECGKYFEGGV